MRLIAFIGVIFMIYDSRANGSFPPCGRPCRVIDVNTGEVVEKAFRYDTETSELHRFALNDKGGPFCPNAGKFEGDPDIVTDSEGRPVGAAVIIETREVRCEKIDTSKEK